MCGPSLSYPADQIWKNPFGKYSNFLFSYLLVDQTLKHVEDWCISHLVCRVTFNLKVWFGNALVPPTKENGTSRCWAGPNLDWDWASFLKHLAVLKLKKFSLVESWVSLIYTWSDYPTLPTCNVFSSVSNFKSTAGYITQSKYNIDSPYLGNSKFSYLT